MGILFNKFTSAVTSLAISLVPHENLEAHSLSGIASYYGHGDGFAMRRTAYGVCMDPEFFGIAHRTLPLGQVVLVEHDGKKAKAVVLDRGPYKKGRSVDLYFGLARYFGIVEAGLAQVKLTPTPVRLSIPPSPKGSCRGEH